MLDAFTKEHSAKVVRNPISLILLSEFWSHESSNPLASCGPRHFNPGIFSQTLHKPRVHVCHSTVILLHSKSEDDYATYHANPPYLLHPGPCITSHRSPPVYLVTKIPMRPHHSFRTSLDPKTPLLRTSQHYQAKRNQGLGLCQSWCPGFPGLAVHGRHGPAVDRALQCNCS